MNILNQLRLRAAQLLLPTKRNSMTLPEQFLKYGNKDMLSNWSETQITDNDLYTGYGYAAIRNRANKVASMATENVRTIGNSNDPEYVHPYIELVNNSLLFSEFQFWSTVSTYLDLEGVYYLMAVRAKVPSKTGKIQYFRLLNPYNIKRLVNKETLEVAGYIEKRQGRQREIPVHQIIEIRDLNPFDADNPYSMTDAAKDSQFTLKTANSYTRDVLHGNINAPGIISTDIQLEEEEFRNFRERIKEHKKGEPIFGNGAGAIKWESMTQELDKSALKDINQVNRDESLAIYGLSKTLLGIEESGTTRETSRVQKELFVENHVIPRIQLIIDAFNLDYQTYYTVEHELTGAEIVVDNPMAVEIDSLIKETEYSEKQFDLYSKLINRKVEPELAAQYVKGEVEIDMIPLEPMELTLVEQPKKTDKPEDNQVKKKNQLEESPIVRQQEGALKNAIVNIEGRLVSSVITRLNKSAVKDGKFKNEFEDTSDLITKTDIKESKTELALVLTTFYSIVETLRGQEVMGQRRLEFNLPGTFELDREAIKYIKEISRKVSDSHVDTVLNDLLVTVREGALAGMSQEQLVSAIKTKYSGDITDGRANVIARTETNRAFTRAQYEADRQFMQYNELEGRVYKQWITRSNNPCEFCLELSRRPAIPFSESFVDLGGHVSVDGKTLDINFESLEAGNAHPNCSCAYELIIK